MLNKLGLRISVQSSSCERRHKCCGRRVALGNPRSTKGAAQCRLVLSSELSSDPVFLLRICCHSMILRVFSHQNDSVIARGEFRKVAGGGLVGGGVSEAI